MGLMSENRITEGGTKLRQYLDEIDMSVPDFCEKHDLDRIQVQRVLNGDRWRRITVDFAYSIQQATSGRVAWTMFLSKNAKPIKRAA